MLRGGYNVLSIVTGKGEMEYSIRDGTFNGEGYIEFLKELILNRDNPLIIYFVSRSRHLPSFKNGS